MSTGTYRFGPFTASRALVPIETRALAKLDEAAALLAEAAGLLAAADQDEIAGRTSLGRFGSSGIAGPLAKDVMTAGAAVRECAAQLEGRKAP